MPGIFDRIKDTTTYSGLLSVGTSFTVTNTPAPIYQSFRSRYAINDANIPVAVVGQATNNWMVCWCTYTALDTLRVDSIIFTSNTVTPDAAVTFSGTSDVFVTASSRAVAGLREVNTFTANNTFSATTYYGTSAHGNIGSDASQMFVRGNNISFQNAASSTTYAYINSSGNVGIGTTSPGERLSVATGASEFAIQWAGPGKSWVLGSAAGRAYIRNKTDSVEAISILNDGKVGIGTTSPSSPLIVNTGVGNFDAFNGATGTISFGNGVASGTASPAIIGAASSSTALRLVGRSVDGLSSGDMAFDARPSAGGDFTTLTNPAFVFARFGTNLATILRNGNVGIGTTGPSSKLSVSDGTVRIDLSPFSGSTGYVGTQSNHPLGIMTNNVEAIRVTTSGNVGIGTTSPTNFGAGYKTVELTGTTGGGVFRSASSTVLTDMYSEATLGIGVIRTVGAYGLRIATNSTERVHITSTGEVGIGTSNPAGYDAKLAVLNGNFALTTTQNKLYLYYVSGTNHAHISTDTGGQVTISNGTGGVAERVRINTDGRVGMGRSPDHALDVQSSSGSTVIRGLSANSPTTILSEVRQDTGYNPAFLTMRRINVAGSATPSSVSIGEIRWDGSTTASVYNAFAAIRCDISTNSVNGAAAAIVFGTASGAAANDVADKVWFHANGGVSIGQAGSPGAGCLRLGRFNNSSEGAELQFCRANDNEVGWYIDLNGAGTGTDPTTMRFVDARSAAVRLELATRGVLSIVNDLGPASTDTLAVGFRGSPNNDRSSAYTIALTDAGRTVRKGGTTAFLVSVPADSAVNFPIGSCIILCNAEPTSGNLTVQSTNTTTAIVYRNGTGRDSRTSANAAYAIAPGGSAMIRKVKADMWTITGSGIT